MEKVLNRPVKTFSKKNQLSAYSKEDIAVGFIIGIQCTLAFCVIVYHLI